MLRLTDPSGEFAPAGFAGSPLVTPVPAGWLVRLGPADLVRLGEETIVGVRAAPSNRALRLVIRAPRAVSVMREELLQRSAVANDVA
ncbi:unannotated protein [freshwater metagenome]|uniref:Unannotated protein n=1 Tax=freshwater metagenome TaxID=449393 RepID=A0A6J7EMQ3_9ZZZZ